MRLAALSNARLNPWISWSALAPPLLNALTSRDDTVLACPPSLTWANRREWRRVVREARGADTLFWLQWSARPELPLWLLAGTVPLARRTALVLDAWRPQLAKIGMLAVAQRLDPCFVAYREACEELELRFPRGRFEWLPVGVDTDYFRPNCGARDVFAYWMGRRFEPLHDALKRYCEDRGLDYRYTRDGEAPKFGESGRLAGRARYFVVTPPDLENSARTGGFSPLAMRYLEGLSAGARLLGVLPRSGEYEFLLPREAILEVSPDGSDLAAKLDDDVASGGAAMAVEHARDLVRSHHSWARRAEQIFARLSTGRPLEPQSLRHTVAATT
jgi:Glycosyl transferases group 1